MTHRYHKTAPTLSGYVQTVLVLDSGLEHSGLPLVTNGMSALLCEITRDDCQITLYGQSVPGEKWTVENNTTLIAFFFTPFVMGPIFKLPVQALKGKVLNLWNAQKAMALKVQLLHAKSTEEKIEWLNHFLFTQIQTNQRECEVIRYTTDKLMQNTHADVLSQLQEELHVTERTFQRIFKKYVGTTPNQYRRICQFYFAFSQLKSGHFEKQIDVAVANGYFDQSHYIRSFRKFADMTPQAYLQKGWMRKEE